MHSTAYCPLYISEGAGKENLVNNRLHLQLLIISFLLVTSMFDSGVILWGENRFLSRLVFKGYRWFKFNSEKNKQGKNQWLVKQCVLISFSSGGTSIPDKPCTAGWQSWTFPYALYYQTEFRSELHSYWQCSLLKSKSQRNFVHYKELEEQNRHTLEQSFSVRLLRRESITRWRTMLIACKNRNVINREIYSLFLAQSSAIEGAVSKSANEPPNLPNFCWKN